MRLASCSLHLFARLVITLNGHITHLTITKSTNFPPFGKFQPLVAYGWLGGLDWVCRPILVPPSLSHEPLFPEER
jgi:hypothetical protein